MFGRRVRGRSGLLASGRGRSLAVGIAAVCASAGLLVACGDDFDPDQAQLDIRETYDLFTQAIFVGDGPVACGLMTPILRDELFTIGPERVTPLDGSCEVRMSQQGELIRAESGDPDPTAELEDAEINLVAKDAGTQPFAPGGVRAWADAESVVGDERDLMRFFLISDDWLIGALPEPFVPDPVLGGEEADKTQAAQPQ